MARKLSSKSLRFLSNKMDQHRASRQRFQIFLSFLEKGKALHWEIREERLEGVTQVRVVRLAKRKSLHQRDHDPGQWMKKMVIRFGICRTKQTKIRRQNRLRVQRLETILCEGTAPSYFPKGSLELRGNQRKPNGRGRKWNRREGGDDKEEKKEETEKHPFE